MAAFLEFAKDALKITPKDISIMPVERARRTRSSPNANAYKEACITFKDQEDRDFVASKAVNLGGFVDMERKPQARIRLNISSFLLPTFHDLNSYAYCVRKVQGKKTKTHVKFDDANMSLFLEIKLPSSEKWLRVSPQRARELTTENNAKELRRLQCELRERNSRIDDLSLIHI